MSVIYLSDWPVPHHISACYTLRTGGVSQPPYDSFNLGQHVNDDPNNVVHNRQLLQQQLQQQTPSALKIVWLQQAHGVNVLNLDEQDFFSGEVSESAIADASVSSIANRVCSVMTADCLPIFFCDAEGTKVAVAHAGWRGLAQGILQHTVLHFPEPQNILVYLGPAISQAAFEVGDDVRDAFLNINPLLGDCFSEQSADKWLADLYDLARYLLMQLGVQNIYGGDRCTYNESKDFFSYRRDGVTGRMANMIWINN